MADNTTVNPGDRPDAIEVATDDIGGVHYPIFKMSYGALETQTPVSNTDQLPVKLYDGFGNPLSSLNGALDVHDPHLHHVPVNEFFHLHTGLVTTLATAATAGDTSIDVVNIAGFAVLDVLQLENGVIETTFPSITNIIGSIITLDRPLDQNLPIGAAVDKILINMNVSGTLANPISFKLIPDADQTWHILSFIIAATFSSVADDSKFGDLAPLTNGCVLRAYNGLIGAFGTFTNWKTNSDIKLDMYDVPYTDKSGGGLFGMNGNGDIKNRTGATPELNGTNGDYLELLIQDDLTALSTFKLKAQGHVENF